MAATRPSLKYGLGVSFDAATVAWPYEQDAVSLDGTAGSAVSGDQGSVFTLEEALKDKDIAAKLHRHAKQIFDADDKLYAWHAASCQRTLVVHLSKGQRSVRPIRIDRTLTGPVRLDKLIVLAEAGSETTLVERLLTAPEQKSSPCCRVAAVDVVAGDGAAVNIISVQNVGDKATVFSRRRAWAAQDSEVRWVNCDFGGEFVSESTSTVLEGAGARTDIKDLFFGRGRQRIDLYQEARHMTTDCRSELACRGALTDGAKAICRGLIHIGRGAGRCQGRQKADTLLLNEAAEVATLPSLEINDDDVRCGHASAVGRLDQEKLFYLMSRGLDPATATRQLVEAFFSPIIGEMKESGLEEMVSCLIGQHFQPSAGVCRS